MVVPFNFAVLDENRVRAHAARLNLTLPHVEQLQLLTRMDSFDVQAAPGCGKTTLVGLKLCLLASGWNSEQQGICVLTYTNTAKDQIRKILDSDQTGRRLLRFPHFVGTFQAFVDTFLSLPHLRSLGIELRAIDDDFYADAASRTLVKGNYFTLRPFLERRKNGEELVRKATYRFTESRLEVFSEAGSLPFKSDTQSGRQFIQIKNRLRDYGIFRYADMFALAHQYLCQNQSLTDSLRWRFPMMLVDEMQDTKRMQDDLLSPIFHIDQCIVQRIGDVNQRIFEEDSDDGEACDFPRAGFLSLPQTMRFGQQIASAASCLTLNQSQDIEGIGDCPNLPPVLIMFNEEQAPLVLERFARLVAECVPRSELNRYPVKAIGARKSSDASKFPKAITCYNPFYRKLPQARTKPEHLFKAVAVAQAGMKSTGQTSTAASVLWDAVSELLRRWEVRVEGRQPTRRSVQYSLEQRGTEFWISFKTSLRRLLALDLNDQVACESAARDLIETLTSVFGLTPTPGATAFCKYDPEDCTADSQANEQGLFLTFSTNAGNVTIGFDTIHNSKGETHAATLILECYSKEGIHDLSDVLPAIVNRQKSQRAKMVSVKRAGLLIFVGMTRPTSLLAFAVLKDHASPYLNDFRSLGWRIEEVADTQTLLPPI